MKDKIKYDVSDFNINQLGKFNVYKQTANLISNNSNILEIGCATGFFAEYLKINKKCTVTGVDINSAQLKRAKNHCKNVVLGDILDSEVDLKIKKIINKENGFDVILSMASIEHLLSPEKFLNQIKQYASEKTKIIITTSNIAHWSMRIKLLFGNFEYEEYGLLDKTHLKFYTFDSFEKLLINEGYKIKKLYIDPWDFPIIPYPKIWRTNFKIGKIIGFFSENLEYKYYSFFRRFIGYQMIFNCYL